MFVGLGREVTQKKGVIRKMRINTNVSAIIANHHLNKTDNMLSQSMQRLSSGLRLNRAEDDSAAIAIAKRMHTQIDSISQTGRNGNDGVSVVQTAEGALNEVHSMLQRMRELAVQGANGTNSDEDRAAIQKEVENLKEEIVRVSEQTQFGNITLLDGSLDRRSYCTVTNLTGVTGITNTSSLGRVVSSTDSVSAGIYGIKVTGKAEQAKVDIGVTLQGATVDKANKGIVKINSVEISIEEGDTKETIEAKIIDTASKIGATYINGTFTTEEYGSAAKVKVEFSNDQVAALFSTTPTTQYSVEAESIEMTISGTLPVETGKAGTIEIDGYTVNIDENDDENAIKSKLSAAAAAKNINYADGTFSKSSGEKVKIVFLNDAMKELFSTSPAAKDSIEVKGKDVVATLDMDGTGKREGFASTAKWSTEREYVTITDNSGFNMRVQVSELGDYSFEVTDIGTMPIQIGVAEGQILDIRIQTVDLETLSLTNVNCSTEEGCTNALADLDKAISYISNVRGCLGAYQNRLESAVRSIEVAEESATGALSQIEDTDMAEEMTYYTQMNVLTQAGVSVLAQANERPQIVLQLLQ